MSDFLNIRDWRKFKQGEKVRVISRGYPEINGNYRLRRIYISSNFPYRIGYHGREILLRKTEVFKLNNLKEKT